MEKELKAYLRENEQICWEGRPAQFSMLDQANRFRILLKWILTVAVAAGLLVAYYTQNPAPTMGFSGVVVLVAAVIVAAPILEYQSLKKARYWITTQRAILMTSDKSLYYMELDELDEFGVLNDAADAPCLVLGRCALEESRGQLRWRACHPKVDLQAHEDADRAQGMIFYCIQNADAAVLLLEQRTRPGTAKSA